MKSDEIITSPQNHRIKALVKLRDRRAGDASRDCIFIDGRREITRALDAGVAIREVFFCPGLLGDEEPARLVLAQERGARLIEVSRSVFARISYGERAEGAVAVADRPRRTLGDLELSRKPLLAIVEAVEKPGNLGAILRSADGAGVEAVIAVDPATDIYGPNVIRSSLGTAFCVPLVEASGRETMKWCADRGIALIAASPAGQVVYTDVDLTGPVALVFGSEAHGLTQAWSKAGAVHVVVPMLGRADSLNVSITAALFFYEALRQRCGAGPASRRHPPRPRR